jgi:tRNA-2-methylthio-N6-dimethylallyladenosine synthase
MEKKIFIKTFGCQMNEYDSNRIYDTVKKIGYLKTENKENVDCYIINTCHIRDKAKEKVYHEVGRIRELYKSKNKPITIITGCVAQAENEEMLKREPYIDMVVGPQSYHKLNSLIKNFEIGKKIEETEFDVVNKFNYLDNTKNGDTNISAYLTIQEGCDKFCNFCVVPFTRGPEYSRPFDKIILEAEELVKNGAREIILLGQNVNAYSFKNQSKEYRLSNLINTLENFSEIDRIRYTTSHPRDMTDDLIDCYSQSKKLMPFVHLPIQSGSNKMLKLMNRKHTVETYIKIYEVLKKINPEIEFSSDFIISYPGEGQDDFLETLNFVKKFRFINSFSFIFSPRPGTKASTLKQIDHEVSKERLIKIQEQLFSHQLNLNKSLINNSIDVLVENEIIGQNKLFGRNKYMNSVIFDGSKKDVGKIIKVNVEKANQNSLFGKTKNQRELLN